MEGLKFTFAGHISEDGTLKINMTELRANMKNHPGKQAIVTVEVLDGGDCVMMLSMYRNNWLPRIVEAWRDLGENYTNEQADRELSKHTSVRCQHRNKEGGLAGVEDLDRELLKQYMDQVAIFAAQNLSLIL